MNLAEMVKNGMFMIMLVMIAVISSCKPKHAANQVMGDKPDDMPVKAKFTMLSPEETGVNFVNRFKEDYTYNIYMYEYLYNGGGVAAGDVNGDSLPDLYFSATFGPNILYLNLGDFKFMNVTIPAGVAAPVGFKTGVAIADINNDGRLDIYSCRTSKTESGKDDHVFINMGNKIQNGVAIPVFEDQAVKLGLNDNSNTNHVCLIDYDKDGDLDVFLLNHKLGFGPEATTLRLKQDEQGNVTRITTPETPYESNRLYRNDNGHFVNVTEKAGLVTSAFGLSATAADLNKDGWMDLYIANDYIEPDRVMINNRDGTFTDKYFEYLKHSSQNSMGADIADFNNDGLVDIVVLDMKPEDPIRYKTLMNVMSYDRYNLLEQYGYGRQVGRNVLQLNNGNNTFSEIGQYAGVAETDWSWGALLADFDNDGWKDIYVSNGYRKDVTNLDYLNFVRDSLERTGGITPQRFPDIYTVLNIVPEQKLSSYLLINNGKLQFINASKQAGVDVPAFSNGSAYADLDNDGDLDLIRNSMVDPSAIFRNDITGQHWLQIELQDNKGNINGIGAEAELYAGGNYQHQMLMLNKGFYSTSQMILHFGLGNTGTIDSIVLKWPDGSHEIMKNVKADQRIYWKRGTGSPYTPPQKSKPNPLFAFQGNIEGWIHQEDKFVDFKRERLLPYMMSYEGPCISTGDLNGDKLEDIFAGNGSGFPAAVFFQTPQNTFIESPGEIFKSDAGHEDCGSVIEDLDGDGDNDLVVISGGNAFALNDPAYLVRYYNNDGKGNFNKVSNFPIIRTNAGSILAFDYDKDNDKDLFIAGRIQPGGFPNPPKSFLLKNENGRFTDATMSVFPQFSELGMISDLKSGDLDGDGTAELIVAGDWMPVTVFSISNSKFIDKTEAFGLSKLTGWWKTVAIDDIDDDGDLDMVCGNMGLNHRLKTSEIYPITLISNDFDGNGSQDPILSYYYQGKLYPFAGKDAVIGQIPMLKKKYIKYTPYASATIEDIFPKEKLESGIQLTANTFKTLYLLNENKKFVAKELPYQVQLSPVYDVIIRDMNGDGRKDILSAGNYLYAETETAEMDAGNGCLLIQQPDKSFAFVENKDHGFWAQGEVRELDMINLANGDKLIITGNNKGPIQLHKVLMNKGPVQ